MKTLTLLIFALATIKCFSQISSSSYCELDITPADSTYKNLDRQPSFKGVSDSIALSREIMIYVGRRVGKYEGEGIVCLSFVINEKGLPENIIAYKSQNHNLSKLAVDLIEDMPRWRPGILNDEKVKVEFRVPFRFTQP